MCVLIFSANLSKTFLVLRRTAWDIIKNVYLCSCTVTVILNVLVIFSKYIHILNFVKIPPKRDELYCVDGRTDGGTYRQTNMKIKVALRHLWTRFGTDIFDKNWLRNIFWLVSRICLGIWMDRRQISTRISNQGSQWSSTNTLCFRNIYIHIWKLLQDILLLI